MRYHTMYPPDALGRPIKTISAIGRGPRPPKLQWAWECVGTDHHGLWNWAPSGCLDPNFKLFFKLSPGHEDCGWIRYERQQ